MSVVWPSFFYANTQGPKSSDLYPAALPVLTEARKIGDVREGGAKSGTGVVSENGTVLPGVPWNGVNWTFYNRILFLPSDKIEIGNMLNAQSRTVTLWNGFLTNKALTNFDTLNADGILVTQPVTPVYQIKPLEELDYTIAISMEGAAIINCNLIWTIAGRDYVVNITGQRAVLFPFMPNFSNDVLENLEWKSNILTAFDGTEQRRALRTKARRGFEYSFSLIGSDAQLFQNVMFAWQNRTFAIPVWTDKCRTSSAHAIGDTVLSVDPTNYSFSTGEMAVLYKSAMDFEVLTIHTVGASSLILEAGLSRAWPAGTVVYPAVFGHTERTVPVQRVTDTVLEGSVTFQTSPDVTSPYTPDASATSVYDGLDVITVQPNWQRDLDWAYEYAFDDVDMNTGPIKWLSSEYAPTNTRRYRWMFQDRASILAFRKFLARMRGMVKTCWVPSWTDDFTVFRDVGVSDASLAVRENGFRLLVGVTAARDRIMVRLKNGTVFYRRIIGVSVDSNGVDARLSLDSAFGTAFLASDVRAVHILNRCRLATDKVVIAWKSDKVATVDTALKVVPQ